MGLDAIKKIIKRVVFFFLQYKHVDDVLIIGKNSEPLLLTREQLDDNVNKYLLQKRLKGHITITVNESDFYLLEMSICAWIPVCSSINISVFPYNQNEVFLKGKISNLIKKFTFSDVAFYVDTISENESTIVIPCGMLLLPREYNSFDFQRNEFVYVDLAGRGGVISSEGKIQKSLKSCIPESDFLYLNKEG